MKKPEQIITNRLVLKSLTDSDRDDMVSILHSEVKKTYMIPDLHNKEEEDKLFNRLKQVTEDSNHFAFGVFLGNKVIGYLNDVEKNDEEIEIGYFISPNKWGHGYASEAFKGAIDALFEMGYQRVYAGFFEGNLASERVMQKCGLRKIDKTESIEYRGVSRPVIYYGINKDERGI